MTPTNATTNGYLDVKLEQRRKSQVSEMGGDYAKMNGHCGKAAPRASLPNNSLCPAPLPKLKDTSPEMQTDLAIQKLKFCQCIVIEDDPLAQGISKQRKTKRAYLSELLTHFRTRKGALSEHVYGDLFAMVAANLFRPLPPPPEFDDEDSLDVDASFSDAKTAKRGSQKSGGADEAEATTANGAPAAKVGTTSDEVWRRELQPVHALLLHVVQSSDFKVVLAKKFLDEQFVRRLFTLLKSPLAKERQFVAKTLRAIYARQIHLQHFVRKQILHALFEFLYEPEPQWNENGVAGLLDVLEEIVDGFKVPLKADERHIFVKALLPLHKTPELDNICEKLFNLLLQFLALNIALAETALKALLKYWPKTNCRKEVLFVEEVEQILQMIGKPLFKKHVGTLFTQVAKCIGSPHFLVADRALSLWKNERIVPLIQENSAQIITLVHAALQQTASSHWNAKIRALAEEVKSTMCSMNPSAWKSATGSEENDVESDDDEPEVSADYVIYAPVEVRCVSPLRRIRNTTKQEVAKPSAANPIPPLSPPSSTSSNVSSSASAMSAPDGRNAGDADEEDEWEWQTVCSGDEDWDDAGQYEYAWV